MAESRKKKIKKEVVRSAESEGALPVIGIPRAYLYYRYGTLWTTFFKELGISYIISPKTGRSTLETGSKRCVGEACLAAKIYFGHVDNLLGRCRYILIPRISSFGVFRVMCTRFESLPDLAHNIYRKEPQKFISYNVDLNHKLSEKDAFIDLGHRLGRTVRESARAYKTAKKADSDVFNRQVRKNRLLLDSSRTKVLLCAHPYVSGDEWIGRPVIQMLQNLDVNVIRADLSPRPDALTQSRKFSPTMKWEVNREIAGGVLRYKDRVDGIILMSVFPCGPDSMTNEVLLRRIHDIPMLNLSIDAQTGTAGLETRIESFIDIIHFKQGRL